MSYVIFDDRTSKDILVKKSSFRTNMGVKDPCVREMHEFTFADDPCGTSYVFDVEDRVIPYKNACATNIRYIKIDASGYDVVWGDAARDLARERLDIGTFYACPEWNDIVHKYNTKFYTKPPKKRKADKKIFSPMDPDFIEKVIFNYPATIILWADGTKTVVKCGEDEQYSPEFGMAMAIAKKFFGNEGNYYNIFRKWLPEEDTLVTPSPVAIALSKIAEAFRKMKDEPFKDESKRYLNSLYGAAGETVMIGIDLSLKELTENTTDENPVITLENGYPPKDALMVKPNDDDTWTEIKPSEDLSDDELCHSACPCDDLDAHLGDNSYERWKKNTPFYHKIKVRREALKMTIRDVANKVGCGSSAVSNWETGKFCPSKEEHRQKLAEVLNYKLDELYEVTEVNGEIRTKVRKREWR